MSASVSLLTGCSAACLVWGLRSIWKGGQSYSLQARLASSAGLAKPAGQWHRRRRIAAFTRSLEAAEEAGLTITAAQLLAVAALAAAGLFGTAWLVFGDAGFAAMVALGGLLAPQWYVVRQKAARQRLLDEQLERTLGQMALVLRAGSTTRQALEHVVQAAPEPLCSEWMLLLRHISLGNSFNEALDTLAQRIPTPAVRFAVSAISLQSETGGSLAGLLDQVCEGLRQRRHQEEAALALTAEGRATAALMVVMPLAIITVMRLLMPELVAPLTHTLTGRIILGLCLGSIAFGWVLVNRIATGIQEA